MILNLSKLSSEYELIVISSFGLSPLRLSWIIFPISFFMSVALFVISFIVIPKADYLQAKFLTQKQQEAQFNIKPSEYGQVFGPWYIYVEGKVGNNYEDITLFMPTDDKDTFVRAKNARIENVQNSMQLILDNGVAMNVMDKEMQQIDYETMTLGYQLGEAKKVSTISDIIEYWQNIDPNDGKMRLLIRNLFISLLPVLSLFFYISLGFYNPRYQKNKNVIYAIVLTTIFMIAIEKLAITKDINMLYGFYAIWLTVSYIIYQVRIKAYY
jgi:lipopolysaccharide export system permease protein